MRLSTSGIGGTLSHFPSLPAREASNDEGGNRQSAGGVSEPPRPINKFALRGGIVLMLVGFPLMGKAFETLFYFDERQHALTIIIFCFFAALVCVAYGSPLIMEISSQSIPSAKQSAHTSPRFTCSRPIAFIAAIKNVTGNAPPLIFAAIEP
jgi:hypothetical protein